MEERILPRVSSLLKVLTSVFLELIKSISPRLNVISKKIYNKENMIPKTAHLFLIFCMIRLHL